MLQRLYDWSMIKAASPHAVWWMSIFAFAEATFFPLPADVLLVPMVLAVRRSAWRLAMLAALSSAVGGCFGYGIGYFLYNQVGEPILQFYGYLTDFERIQVLYRRYGELIVAIGGITPIPYKAVTIASGVAQMDFWAFSTVSVISRVARFFVVCAALYYLGPLVRDFIEKNLHLSAGIALALFVGGFSMVALIV